MAFDFTVDYTTPHASRWLEYLGQYKDAETHFLEVGSFEGRSAIWMLQNILTHAKSTITCVDVWGGAAAEHRFDRNVVKTGLSHKVIKIKRQSCVALRHLAFETFDFIYVDGCHEGMNVIEDGVLAYRLLKKGGLMIFDDYPWQGEHRRLMPKPAIDAFLHLYPVEHLHKEWQVIIRK